MEALWLRERKQYKSGDFISCLYRTPADVRMLARFLHRHDYAVYVPVSSGHGTPDVEDILASSPELVMKMPNVLSALFEEGFPHGGCIRIIDGRMATN